MLLCAKNTQCSVTMTNNNECKLYSCIKKLNETSSLSLSTENIYLKKSFHTASLNCLLECNFHKIF